MSSALYILCIDIEATGQLLDKHGMIQFGAVLMDPNTRKIARWNNGMGEEVKFSSWLNLSDGYRVYGWCEDTVRDFWAKHPEIYQRAIYESSNGPSPLIVMNQFVNWLETVKNEFTSNIQVLLDTCAFDSSFMNLYLSRYANHKGLNFITGKYRPTHNTKSWYLGLGKKAPHEDAWNTEIHACFQLKCKKSSFSDLNNVHDALRDATYIGRVYCEMVVNMKKSNF